MEQIIRNYPGGMTELPLHFDAKIIKEKLFPDETTYHSIADFIDWAISFGMAIETGTEKRRSTTKTEMWGLVKLYKKTDRGAAC